jgi:hypothetical protein
MTLSGIDEYCIGTYLFSIELLSYIDFGIKGKN